MSDEQPPKIRLNISCVLAQRAVIRKLQQVIRFSEHSGICKLLSKIWLKQVNPIGLCPGLTRRFKLYDSIFLNVLEKHRHPADDIFTRVYTKNPGRVFTFLDEETRFIGMNYFCSLPCHFCHL